MTTTLLTHLHTPIYKIIPYSPYIYLLSSNKIIEFNLLTNTTITHYNITKKLKPGNRHYRALQNGWLMILLFS